MTHKFAKMLSLINISGENESGQSEPLGDGNLHKLNEQIDSLSISKLDRLI